jgi:hypothetical protein
LTFLPCQTQGKPQNLTILDIERSHHHHLASKQEKFLKKKGKFKNKITALSKMEDKDLEEPDLDEETFNKINHARTKQGRQPYLRFNIFRNNKPNQGGQRVRSNDNGHKNGNQNRVDWKRCYCNGPWSPASCHFSPIY